MDVAFVSRFEDGRQVIGTVAGDADSFHLRGQNLSLDQTYCSRMVAGTLPKLIADTADEPMAAALPVTGEAGIGAYIGVPLLLPDGEVYGTFCCLSHQAAPALTQRDVGFMALLSDLLAGEIAEESRLHRHRRRLERTIATGAVNMAAQPILDLVDGRCREMEALARFDAGLGAPDVVFALAEQVGLRQDLELLCIGKALTLLDVFPPHQALAVNMSPDIAITLPDVLPPDVPLKRLIVELTEHAAVSTYEELRSALQPLRSQGLRLAIDDAGAGFASLRHVVELRPEIIKVDRSLVAGISDDLARRSVVTTFVLLALDIGASVIAEGVETRDELRTLMALGVDAAQGYLIHRPTTDLAELQGWTADRQTQPQHLQGVWTGESTVGARS
jgi:EAL domain-containing protein (putative c-di-GMP-specific phosphodiesterase class I)